MPQQTAASWLDSPEVTGVAFHPRRERESGGGHGFDTLDIPVGDGVTVGARFYAAGSEKPTLLFFHGNGEIVADYDDIARFYVATGANFLPVDYRGYGRSSGRPTISTMLADATAVFNFVRRWLLARKCDSTVIVMGRSLGSAPALEVAAANPTDTAGLIVDSGFSDVVRLMVRLGAPQVAALPLDGVTSQEQKIAAYHGPTLIIHGTRDTIIPAADAEALFRASGSATKRLLKIDGAGHNNLLALALSEYMQAVAQLVDLVRARRK